MLNDKHGTIGKALRGIRPEHRELWFIFCQMSASQLCIISTSLICTLVYSIIFMVFPAALYIRSARATYVFLVLLLAVSTWNGATFYVEVFGRKSVLPVQSRR